jgi:hypothetical protein
MLERIRFSRDCAFEHHVEIFYGHTFNPDKIIITFPTELIGNTISVEVEVVDEPIDYYILLGHSWFYAMMVVVSLIF